MQRTNDRTDIATFGKYPKSELLRLVVKEGRLAVDLQGNLSGRGCYLKKDAASLELALRKKAFNRFLHRPITDEEIERIKEAL